MRRHYGISAEEAYTQIPAWEVDLLIDALVEESEHVSGQKPRRTRGTGTDPFAIAPEIGLPDV